MTKQCLTCKKEYSAKKSSQLYCGKPCQTKGQQKREVRECKRLECFLKFEETPLSTRVYCSRSCAAIVNNRSAPKRRKAKTCDRCENPIASQRKYCEKHISSRHLDSRAEYIEQWLAGEVSGGSARSISSKVRSYLLSKAGYACEECGFDTPHPLDGKTILEIDHIDGDGENHRPENLRVLCPNCHALTETYRGRNIGKGRKVFYTRHVR